MKKIIIFGGCGFIGSNLAFELLKKNKFSEIIIVDNLSRDGVKHNYQDLLNKGIKIIKKNAESITKNDLMLSHDDENIFVDFAANPSVLSGICPKSSIYKLFKDNFIGLAKIIDLARNFSGKILFLSSSRIIPLNYFTKINFRHDGTRFFPTERKYYEFETSSSLLGIKSLYGSSKFFCENLLEEASFCSNIKYKIIRPGVVAGPRQMGSVEQGFLSLWVKNIIENNSLSYIGYGNKGYQVRDIVHVLDLCNYLINIIENDLFDNSSTFYGGGIENSISLFELTNLCQEIIGKNAKILNKNLIESIYDTPYVVIPQLDQTNKLGFKIKFSIKTIVEDTVEYYLTFNKKTVS